MKANELRLGNYVDITRMVGEVRIPTGRTFKTVGVSMFNSSLVAATVNPATEEHWPNYANTHIEPIPLTEDWLEKFGAKSVGKLHPSWRLNGFYIEEALLKDGYNFRQILNKEESLMLRKIKYVHTLQNLYFSLTGKELEVKSAN